MLFQWYSLARQLAVTLTIAAIRNIAIIKETIGIDELWWLKILRKYLKNLDIDSRHKSQERIQWKEIKGAKRYSTLKCSKKCLHLVRARQYNGAAHYLKIRWI